MIRDRIVVGILDCHLSEKLQMEPELTLEKAVTQVRQSESVKKQQGTLRSEKQKDIDGISSQQQEEVNSSSYKLERSRCT